MSVLPRKGDRGSYDHRHTAFEVVEWGIYVAAILGLLTNPSLASIDGGPMKFPYQVLIFAFILILVRNYVVMQSIDKDETTHLESYRFIEIQRSAWIWAERITRLAIIFVVVATLKSILFVSWAMNLLGEALLHLITWVGRILAIYTARPVESSFAPVHNELIYYASVLFTLALLSIIWDLVSVIAYKSCELRSIPKDSRREHLGVSVESNSIGSDVYQSLLMYLNLYRVPFGKSRFEFDHVMLKRLSKSLENGNVIRLYFASWKFWERALVVFFSWLLIAAAISRMSPGVDLALGLTVAIYVFVAAKNQRYFTDFLLAIVFPAFYLVKNRWAKPALIAPEGSQVQSS